MISNLKIFAISAFIVTCLGLQAIVGSTYHAGSRWPFVSYPMYANSKQDGDRVTDYTLSAHYADGSTKTVSAEGLGLSFWIMRQNYITPMIKGDFETLGDSAVAIICDTYGSDIDRLDVFDIGVAVGQQGAVYSDPALIATNDVSCPA